MTLATHISCLRWAIAVLLAVSAIVVWLTAGLFGQSLLAEVAIFAIFAMGVDLAAGHIGLMSIGHAMYFAMGAYGIALLGKAGLAPGFAALVAVMATLAIAALIGHVIVRFGETIFIMLSLALSEMFYSFLFANRALGGSDGIAGVKRVDLGFIGVDAKSPATFALITVLSGVFVFVALDRIVTSPFGLVATAVRQNPIRARAMGTPINAVRTAVYALSAAVSAFAGCLLAQLNGFVSPDLASWTTSGLVLIMAILGGLGSISGAALGAVVVQTASHFIARLTGYWGFYLGLIFVVVVLFAENGLFALLRSATRRMTPASQPSSGQPVAASDQRT